MLHYLRCSFFFRNSFIAHNVSVTEPSSGVNDYNTKCECLYTQKTSKVQWLREELKGGVGCWQVQVRGQQVGVRGCQFLGVGGVQSFDLLLPPEFLAYQCGHFMS